MEEKSQESQGSQEKPGGNTKTPGNIWQMYRFSVTLPYEEIEASQLSQHLNVFCKSFTFQGEIGESGYKHWQIELSLQTKLKMQEFKNLLGFNKAHIEPTKNYFAAKNYCSKSETRIEGPYTEKTTFLKTIEKLRPWQQTCLDLLLSPPDDRTIYWYYDPTGNKGKTQFCKYMAVKHGAIVLNNGAFKDLACALPDNPKMVLFNFPRSIEGAVNYGAIECIKDGMIFSAKYESKMKLFNSPHIVIMCNFLPRTEEMSMDRWKIINLDEDVISEEKD